MSRASIYTPCPAPHALFDLTAPALGAGSSAADDTAEIDYTHAIQVEFKNARPRRKTRFQRERAKDTVVTIFEDAEEDAACEAGTGRHLGGSTLLGRPAQRMPARGMPKKDPAIIEELRPLRPIGQARKGVRALPNEQVAEDALLNHGCTAEPVGTLQGHHESLKKEARRRTIFVPTEDTTMLTIHPGSYTTDRLNDTFLLNGPNSVFDHVLAEVDAEGDQQARKSISKPRKSFAIAPKRLPLQQVEPQTHNLPVVDVPGKNGGKENQPPKGTEVGTFSTVHKAAAGLSLDKPKAVTSKLFEQTAASQAKQSVVVRKAVPLPRSYQHVPSPKPKRSPKLSRARDGPVAVQARPAHKSVMIGKDAERATAPKQGNIAAQDSAFTISKPRPKSIAKRPNRLQQYPVLSENLAQPELYENDWLKHQEIALTALINQIFTSAEPELEEWERPSPSLRERFIEIYHQPRVLTLHERLQASLLYGALSRPRDTVGPPDPAQDIGLRRRFLSLWLESYDQDSLCVAAEVVFGRELPKRSSNVGPHSIGASESVLDPHRSRRSLIGFLETFLVEVEDAASPIETHGDDRIARWRKMVLRSLKLIWLLDQAKISGVVTRGLFMPACSSKSSVAILHKLAGMLIPSIGDITRILHHLDYDLSHVQDPLNEVKYRIENIAVDLRDGILLTKLTEILLFGPQRKNSGETAEDATITLQMPDFTSLESAVTDHNGARSRNVLSQHLKMPCLGRAQKVFNVQVAMSALCEYGRLGDKEHDVTAEDIVDGHREKTLSLVWSLVSNYGLQQLVDFHELASNIGNAGYQINKVFDEDCNRLSQRQQEDLLEQWARACCARKGLSVDNLTTSFADGKAYAYILDALPVSASTRPTELPASPSIHTSRLETRLRAFGCSTAFTKQLLMSRDCIPNRKTTLSNLAFLASRLLPLARRHNAAIVIQRAFRLRRTRCVMSNRIILARLAHACATVVQTNQKVTLAAILLQRAWRRVLDVRIRRLHQGVEVFQAVARSWLSRLEARSEHGSIFEDHARRTRGGW